MENLPQHLKDEYNDLAMGMAFGCITVASEDRMRVIELIAKAKARGM